MRTVVEETKMKNKEKTKRILSEKLIKARIEKINIKNKEKLTDIRHINAKEYTYITRITDKKVKLFRDNRLSWDVNRLTKTSWDSLLFLYWRLNCIQGKS